MNEFSFGAVVIGRNEGARLKQCLQSLSTASIIVYVDSGSTDGSVAIAQKETALIVELNHDAPFTAARARNAGFKLMRQVAPGLAYVQFADGDCEFDAAWPMEAGRFLQLNRDFAVACGRLRERNPEQSIYNWLCDQEWSGKPGEVRSCGGNAMMRADAFEQVGGFREDLIAGEEPEFCFRLRASNWRIQKLENNMALHDAAMNHFSQWWRRSVRTGYAFANGAYLCGSSKERFYVWETLRTSAFGIWLPIICLAVALAYPRGWIALMIYPLHYLQKIVRGSGPLKDRLRLELFHLLVLFPQGLGQVQFLRDLVLGRKAYIIQHL